ncbi:MULTISPECIES: hypothetical protein [unclassified Clostridium]|uniref:hypothetical protein n=1 Tax=unclassified Clostridium TaxID=2614128 RepID=UPI0002980175|nr:MULTISPECIES: hypothetical protein [unclassified Clostridium]EKQ53153.1 MAG: hypothetical protein A370_03839 [Clostridium sp. Maddingley MBC34-26]
MKILIIKKKLLLNAILYIGTFFGIITLVYFISNNFETLQTISPVNISQDTYCDLTGDGIKDTLELSNSQNKVDFNIKCSTDNYYLSEQLKDKTLFTNNTHWEPKVYLHDISRDNVPEIILIGSKNNKPISYVFHWDKNKFDLVSSSENNIFGILDCKNSKTPQCFSISSSEGLSSLKSFMLINNKVLDTSKDNSNIPSLDSVVKFINIIELPYVLDDLPDIFIPEIDRNNLSLLWNLDKDNYSYAFQNAFFYDYKWTDSGEPSSIRWRISFEKSKLRGADSNKTELILLLDLEKVDSYYKINSIQKVS